MQSEYSGCNTASSPAEARPPLAQDCSTVDHEPIVAPTLARLRVLICGDDVYPSQTIINYLNIRGLYATYAAGLQRLDGQLRRQEPHLVILDVKLEDELAYLRYIRERSTVSVITIANERSDKTDAVVCIECGADDWIARPFGLQELFARVHAILRRRIGPNQPSRKIHRYRFAGWQLDREARRLTNPADALVKLTKSEFALLAAFLEAPRRPLSRQQLIQATRIHADVSDRTVDVQVRRLRVKLGHDGKTNILQTKLGLGYMLDASVEVA
jgi:two-component system OmpR family response regulator